MSTNNIFQVLSDSDVEEIFNENTQSLIILMFSSKNCGPCMDVKPTFINLAKEHKDCIFLYIDIHNFKDEGGQIMKNVEATPKFSYYFNKQEIAYILGAEKSVLLKTVQDLKDKIEAKKREILAYEQENRQKELMKKDLLQKLYELSQQGVRLSQQYNMNSDLNEMKWEYEYHLRMLKNGNGPNTSTEAGNQATNNTSGALDQSFNPANSSELNHNQNPQQAQTQSHQSHEVNNEQVNNWVPDTHITTETHLEQGQTSGQEEGPNLGLNQGPNQWLNQGSIQGLNQGSNRGSNQVSNQVSNQELSQGQTFNQTQVYPSQPANGFGTGNNNGTNPTNTSGPETVPNDFNRQGVNSVPNVPNEMQQKQEKLRKIQELNNINNMMEMEQLFQIQKLKQLQRMKEQNERRKGGNHETERNN